MPSNIKEELHTEKEINSNLTDSSAKIIGYIADHPVYEKGFLILYTRAKAVGEDNPYSYAIEHMKRQVMEAKYAAENNIYPTDDEVAAYTEEQKTAVKSDADSSEYITQYCNELGISEGDYWNIYKPEDDRKYLIHLAVINDIYAKTGKEEDLDISDATFQIIDDNFSQQKIEETEMQIRTKE